MDRPFDSQNKDYIDFLRKILKFARNKCLFVIKVNRVKLNGFEIPERETVKLRY